MFQCLIYISCIFDEIPESEDGSIGCFVYWEIITPCLNITHVRLLPLGVVGNTCNTMVDFDICNIKELHVCGLVNLKRGASVIDGKS